MNERAGESKIGEPRLDVSRELDEHLPAALDEFDEPLYKFKPPPRIVSFARKPHKSKDMRNGLMVRHSAVIDVALGAIAYFSSRRLLLRAKAAYCSPQSTSQPQL